MHGRCAHWDGLNAQLAVRFGFGGLVPSSHAVGGASGASSPEEMGVFLRIPVSTKGQHASE